MKNHSYNRTVFHGGDLSWAKAHFTESSEGWIDLSTGINPAPYPVPPLPEDLWHRLPGADEETSLLIAARHYYNLPDGTHIIAAPGTQSLLQLIPCLRQKSVVAVVGPTYAEHENCWKLAGHKVIQTPDLGAAPENADVIVVVSPNNPSANVASLTKLQQARDRLSRHGGLLVIDEAFMDMTPNASCCHRLPCSNVLILKSFGKFFGLAGLRLGFAIGDPLRIENLRQHLGPWAVNGPALHIGHKALCDQQWIKKTRERLKSNRQRLEHLLSQHNIQVLGSTDLFSFAHSDTANRLFDHLCKAHILTRPFPSRSGKLRFGHPGAEIEWERLGSALSDFSSLRQTGDPYS